MKKLLIPLISILSLAACKDYSKCPVNPYGKHELRMDIYHSTYHWDKCTYCGISVRVEDGSNEVIVNIPGEYNSITLPKSVFYPN